MRVSEVTDLLFERFPRDAAEPWDRPGLSVGDPDARVAGIACALDATPRTIRAAHEAGCNVLVTHHPAFLEPPFPVTPDIRDGSIGGSCVWWAARLGVSLVAMHTNLDRSDAALDLAAELLGLERTGRLFEPDGFGAWLRAAGVTTGELARRCRDSFGCAPIVWGQDGRHLETVAFSSGSFGSFASQAIARGVNLVIAGEAGYHHLSELAEAGVDAILLGHDASELPYAALLARTLAAGVTDDTSIEVLDEGLRWHAWAAEE